MRFRSNLLVCMVLALVLGGCRLNRDVTANPEGRTDYLAGRTYRLKQPVFLFKTNRDNSKETARLAKLGFGGTASNLDEFQRRAPNASQVAGLLMPGDRIKITRFKQSKVPGLGTFFNVYGVVISGENSGATARLDLISKEWGVGNRAFVDPEYLELVD